jgi:coenzyme F420-reducing hydrogenase delta subunit
VIVAFACENCAQGSANTAGVLRMHYDSRINIVRVPCAGRVGPKQIINALNEGAEAVAVIGCCFGACHYGDGNLVSLRRVKAIKKLLEELGFDPNKVSMYTSRAAEGETIVGDFKDIVAKVYSDGSQEAVTE